MLRILIIGSLAAAALLGAEEPSVPKLAAEQRLAAEQARRRFYESNEQFEKVKKQTQDLADEANRLITALREECVGKDPKAPTGVFDTDALTCTAPPKEAKEAKK